MKLKITLTPCGHYFFGTERNFTYDSDIERQYSEGYLIRSKYLPAQTSLFGTLRYILGVENERVLPNAEELIGAQSFDITVNEQNFGKIRSISPLFLEKNEAEYYIRTPFDHTVGEKYYVPLQYDDQKVEALLYPSRNVKKQSIFSKFQAKKGVPHSFMSLDSKEIISEEEVFEPSSEVVSYKAKKIATGSDDKAFARKEYVRLKNGFHFVFFADVDDCPFPQEKTVTIGKDSSVFAATIRESLDEETAYEKIQSVFADRASSFRYLMSDCYLAEPVSNLYEKATASIIDTETTRIFETVEEAGRQRLRPKSRTALIHLLKAGSIIYLDDIQLLTNQHARIAGMNSIITGGTK